MGKNEGFFKMRSRNTMTHRPSGGGGGRALFVLVLIVLLALIAGLGMTYKRWEGQPPEISFDRDVKTLGKAPQLGLKVSDAGTGLKHVTLRLKQKDQEVVLADESFDRASAEKSRSYDAAKLFAEKFKLQDGPVRLTVSATDHSLRHFMR